MRSILFAVVLAAVTGSASAGLCDAPFMHDNGYTRLQGSGVLRLGASLHFSQVQKTSDQVCEARITGKASYGLAGLPDGTSSLDYFMVVKHGHAYFERRDDDGASQAVKGKFDLRMLGLFAYSEPITTAGQTFPEMYFQINVDRKAMDTQPIRVQTSEKVVGQAQAIDTAAGRKQCWPIRYTRTIDPTQASFKGLVLPIPGMVSKVTDWFCPELDMVMRQDSQQQGVNSVVEVTELR